MTTRPFSVIEKKKVTFPDLDIVKLLMAILVVEIHTRPFGATSLVQGVDCVAVPFFFISSAFLCFRGLNTAQFSNSKSSACTRVRNTTKRLLQLYLIWTLIYIPVSLFGYINSGLTPLKTLLYFIRGTILVGENIYTWPLWYLLASVVAFLLVFLLLRWRLHPFHVLGVAAAFALLGFTISFVHEWSATPAFLTRVIDLYFIVFATVRNGLFTGFFYVALGMCLGIEWEHAATVPPMISICLIAFGAAGCIFLSADAHLPFCASYALGVFLLSIHRYGEGSGGHALLRNASTGIYLTHMFFVVLFIYGICGSTDPSSTTNSQVPHTMTFLFSIVCSLIVSIGASVLARKHQIVKKLFCY